MNPLHWLWNPEEKRLRAGVRIPAQALLGFGLILLPIRLVADPISASYKHGGGFGPEGGLVGCAAALLGIAAIAAYARVRNGGLRPALAPRWLRPERACAGPVLAPADGSGSIRT